MPFITLDLLRRRAEHNDGILSNLEEITLHQQELERIELVGDVCRNLQILYLQNNLIPRIEGLIHLKQLWYLNLAINNIKVIEGLEGCEKLSKLDLTLNFVEDITCVRRLRKNIHLKQLYLTGNPCTDIDGYRAYVIEQLPHIISLDGTDVKRSESIRAHQDAEPVRDFLEKERLRIEREEREKQERYARGEFDPPKYNEKGERLYGNSPEERVACFQELRDNVEKAKNPKKDPGSISAAFEESEKLRKPRRLTPAEEQAKYGRVLQKNEGKIPFKMWEDKENVYLSCEPGRFIATSSIIVDIQPTYARVEVKGKALQMILPSEVAPSRSKVQRGQAKGELLLTMPIVGEHKGAVDLTAPWTPETRRQGYSSAKQRAAAAAAPAAEEPRKEAAGPPPRDALLALEKPSAEAPEPAPAARASGIEEID
eukprot:TRINITY_DN12107_c1_g1_i1.p1 TRINITY_DN12107_c1_g1~~TRINITY_DN12107_c1_g1_i1.p1  ORF type:complete len:453 (+),score=209.07 TRINITY_DN12107_c1_g1_i1:79-1359(+)